MSSRSKPSLVPSASIELRRISPAPSAAARAHHSTASRPVRVRPPCVVTSKPPTRRTGLVASTPHVGGEHEHLRAEPVGGLGDEVRPGDGRRVDPDLVGAGPQQPVDVVDGAHSPADGQRDEDLLGRARDDVVHRLAGAAAGGDVEEGQLVGALLAVAAGQLDRVAGVAEVLEVDALDDAAGVDVEARDDAHRHGHAPTVPSTRLATMAAPSLEHERTDRADPAHVAAVVAAARAALAADTRPPGAPSSSPSTGAAGRARPSSAPPSPRPSGAPWSTSTTSTPAGTGWPRASPSSPPTSSSRSRGERRAATAAGTGCARDPAGSCPCRPARSSSSRAAASSSSRRASHATVRVLGRRARRRAPPPGPGPRRRDLRPALGAVGRPGGARLRVGPVAERADLVLRTGPP